MVYHRLKVGVIGAMNSHNIPQKWGGASAPKIKHTGKINNK